MRMILAIAGKPITLISAPGSAAHRSAIIALGMNPPDSA
jgi:hypothetical protein